MKVKVRKVVKIVPKDDCTTISPNVSWIDSLGERVRTSIKILKNATVATSFAELHGANNEHKCTQPNSVNEMLMSHGKSSIRSLTLVDLEDPLLYKKILFISKDHRTVWHIQNVGTDGTIVLLGHTCVIDRRVVYPNLIEFEQSFLPEVHTMIDCEYEQSQNNKNINNKGELL